MGVLLKFSKQFNEPADNLKSEMAGAAKDGIPLNREDLGDKAPSSDADNGAVEYSRAAILYEKLKPSHKALEAYFGGASGTQEKAQALKEVEAFKPILALVEKGASKHDCYFPSPKSPDEVPPWSAPMYALNKGFLKGAILFAPTSGAGLATAALHGKRAGHLLNQGRLSSALLGIGTLRAIDSAVCAVARANPESAQTLSQAQATLEGLPQPPNGRTMFGIEIVEQLDRFSRATACDGPLSEDKVQRQTFDLVCKMGSQSAQPLVAGLQSRFVHGVRQAWKAWPEHGDDFVKCEEALLVPVRAENNDSSAAAELYRQYMSTDEVWQRIIDTEHLLRWKLASKRAAHAFLWILAERLRTGKLPASLDVRDPEMIDPYAGGPLRYERQDKGFSVYSLGPSGRGAGAAKGELILERFP